MTTEAVLLHRQMVVVAQTIHLWFNWYQPASGEPTQVLA